MRIILTIVLSAVIASLVFFAVAFVDNALRPRTPEPTDSATPQAIEKRVKSTPTSKWIAVMGGLALGAFVGGFAAAKVAGGETAGTAIGVGLLLTPWAGYTFYVVYPAVLWVPTGMLLSVLLFAHLGGLLARRSKSASC